MKPTHPPVTVSSLRSMLTQIAGEVEQLVETDCIPEDAEIAVLARQTMKTVEALDQQPPPPEVIVYVFDDHDMDYEDDVFALVCPYDGCDGDAVYEVDRSERWNEVEISEPGNHQPDMVNDPGTFRILEDADGRYRGTHYDKTPNPLAGLPRAVTHQYGDTSFETVGFICQSCRRDVTIPEWIEMEWT